MTTQAELYANVTDSIVAQLERGVRPWAKSWDAKGAAFSVLPLRANGEAYRGINVLMLWGAMTAKGYASPTFMTFNQAKAEGGMVRKGEKASDVVKGGKFVVDEGTDDERAIPFLKGYKVFNVEQIDGLPESRYSSPAKLPEAVTIPAAESFFNALGIDTRHGGERAYYSPGGEYIQLPPIQAFTCPEAYYATRGHECVHWTGHESRLAREFGKRFGDSAYAFEELIAELGAAFLAARLGLYAEPREDHASYLASWLKVLKQDSKAIFTASTAAQRAVDFLYEKASPQA